MGEWRQWKQKSGRGEYRPAPRSHSLAPPLILSPTGTDPAREKARKERATATTKGAHKKKRREEDAADAAAAQAAAAGIEAVRGRGRPVAPAAVAFFCSECSTPPPRGQN